MFWIGNHFEVDFRQNFADTLAKAIEQGYTKEMLADILKDQFNDLPTDHLIIGRGWHSIQLSESGNSAGCKAIRKPKPDTRHSGLDPESMTTS